MGFNWSSLRRRWQLLLSLVKNSLSQKNKDIIKRMKINLKNRPFYSWGLSCLAFEWSWGWCWPCYRPFCHIWRFDSVCSFHCFCFSCSSIFSLIYDGFQSGHVDLVKNKRNCLYESSRDGFHSRDRRPCYLHFHFSEDCYGQSIWSPWRKVKTTYRSHFVFLIQITWYCHASFPCISYASSLSAPGYAYICTCSEWHFKGTFP